MIAAYAFVLQSILAMTVAAGVIAQGDAVYGGTYFIICDSRGNHAAADDGASRPQKSITHCPICALSMSAAALAADQTVLPYAAPDWRPTVTAQNPFTLVRYAARPPSRGPPANACGVGRQSSTT